jgi:hypothetical protein
MRSPRPSHAVTISAAMSTPARSPVVDDRLSREQNVARLRLLLDFFQNGTRLLRGDQKFWLIELPR